MERNVTAMAVYPARGREERSRFRRHGRKKGGRSVQDRRKKGCASREMAAPCDFARLGPLPVCALALRVISALCHPSRRGAFVSSRAQRVAFGSSRAQRVAFGSSRAQRVAFGSSRAQRGICFCCFSAPEPNSRSLAALRDDTSKHVDAKRKHARACGKALPPQEIWLGGLDWTPRLAESP